MLKYEGRKILAVSASSSDPNRWNVKVLTITPDSVKHLVWFLSHCILQLSLTPSLKIDLKPQQLASCILSGILTL